MKLYLAASWRSLQGQPPSLGVWILDDLCLSLEKLISKESVSRSPRTQQRCGLKSIRGLHVSLKGAKSQPQQSMKFRTWNTHSLLGFFWHRTFYQDPAVRFLHCFGDNCNWANSHVQEHLSTEFIYIWEKASFCSHQVIVKWCKSPIVG